MTRPRAPWTPPLRDGVGASRIAVSGGPWPSVLDFLMARLPAGGDWRARLAQGVVLDLQGRPLAAQDAAMPGSVLWYWRSLPPETPVPGEVEIVHRDEHLVVVDKPHFLPVTPGGRYLQETVLVRLKRQLGIETLVPVHRLDRETAGLLMFTVQPAARQAYHRLLRERRVHKVYEAVAPWRDGLALPCTLENRLEEPRGADFMQMRSVPGEPNAVTQVALIARLGTVPDDPCWGLQDVRGEGLAHYRLTPLTGRKHQLRVHLHMLGIPIAGDRIYPRLWPAQAPDDAPDFTRPLQLLARELAFVDPLDGRERRFTSRRRLLLADNAAPLRPHALP